MKTFVRTRFRQRPLNESDASASASESPGKAITGRSQGSSLSGKRSSSTAQMALPASFKRSCSSLESFNPGSPIHNRVHRRIVTRDPGKPIHQASSLGTIINGFIGAIEGHESLLNAGILHRDISIGNIMLTENEDNGFLIDLDLAVKTTNHRASGAPSKTGTKVFMAIGALKGEHHNTMHDLESFFWVLFWICIHWNGPSQERRKVKEFEEWNKESTQKLANIKIGMVSEEDGFDKEMNENFSEYCKPLIPCVQELRKVVFPGGKRRLSEDRELYSRMTDIFGKAREDLEL